MAFLPHPGVAAHIQDFYSALNYLMKGSPLARKMLTALENHPHTIRVLVKEKYEEQGVEGSRFRGPDDYIHWWVYDWTEVKKDEFMNPAMALIHEIGHAYQWLIGGLIDKIEMKLHMVSRVEENNLNNCEKPIAKELGQPQRTKYTDNIAMGNRESDFRKWGKGPYRQLT